MNGLTRFLCDLMDCQQGKLHPDEVRARWKDGAYAGVRPEWASAYFKLHNLGR